MPLNSSARKASTAYFWIFIYLRGLELRGNQQLRAFFEIFCGVIVEFAVRDDFTGYGGFWIVIAEDGNFDFARDDALLN